MKNTLIFSLLRDMIISHSDKNKEIVFKRRNK